MIDWNLAATITVGILCAKIISYLSSVLINRSNVIDKNISSGVGGGRMDKAS